MYSLVQSWRYSVILVAWPRQIGSTPVAAGSRVPACPTRFSPASRRTNATMLKEVHPDGLFTFSIPFAPIGPFRFVLYCDLFYEVDKVYAALDRIIELKTQFGSDTDI